MGPHASGYAALEYGGGQGAMEVASWSVARLGGRRNRGSHRI
jgi:hypothetical protein